MAKRVGFFGGSFDPLHIGHLSLAIAMQECGAIDEVLFVPAHISPFKTDRPPQASGQHRLQMLRLALAGLPGFSVSDIELRREAPSYTIDSIRMLMEQTQQTFHLMMKETAISTLSSWKQAAELMQLAPPL